MQWQWMGKVYSYTRFSTPEQAAGDSYRRQTEAAQRWAEKRGLRLDERLSFADEGISAYRGANTDRGLGAFLEACRKGLVEPDSYLLVESLDRVSRMTPRKAQRLFDDIVDSGVTIVTLNDGQEYTAERLDNDPTALLISLMVSWRAHEESKTKGKRVAEAWAAKRERVRSGEDKLLTRRGPAWLEWREEEWKLIPEHVESVRRVYRMTLEGTGEHSIAKALNKEGVPVMGRGKAWHRSSIAKLLRNPAVIGHLVPGHMEFTEGKRRRVTEEPIPGVYPAVISEEDWLAVRALKDGSTSSPRGRGANQPLQNIFAGLGRCPECGAAMTRVFKGRKSGGKPKLVCTLAKVGKADHPYRSIDQGEVVEAFFDNWQTLLSDVPAGDGDDRLDAVVRDLEGAIGAKMDHLQELEEQLRERSVQAGVRAARRVEEELKTLREELREAEERRELSDAGLVAVRLAALGDAIDPEDGEPETAKVNAALRSLFDGVVVDYQTGFLRFLWKQGGETSFMFKWVE